MSEERELYGGSGAERVVRLARSLLAKGGVLESRAAGQSITRTRLADEIERRIELNEEFHSLPASLTARAAAAAALASAESALNKTAGGVPASALADMEIAGLEAIIEVTGRPAMRYRHGQVQMPPNNLGDNDRWRVLIATARSRINAASAKVGRISTTGTAGTIEHWGTGWSAEGGLIVTNRHVVRHLVSGPDSPPSSWVIDASRQPFINFAAEDGSPGSGFPITGVAYCAEDEIIDIAFLRTGPGSIPHPAPLPLDMEPMAVGNELTAAEGAGPHFQGREVYLVGHPYKRLRTEVIEAVFGVADGGKRWSPGVVVRVEPDGPLLEHDCSTLGGNSGSCVLTASGHSVVGIHVAGLDVDFASGMGRANRALAFSRLASDRVTEILRTGVV